LVTPAGLRKDELTPDDLVVVRLGHDDRDAVSRSGRGPTSDLAIHLAVHAARPDIGAMAHAHLPAAMALTLAGEVPDPAALPETTLLLPRLPFLSLGIPGARSWPPASPIFGTRRAAGPLASAVLLERYGAVAVGRDPQHAVDRLELVEVPCRTWRDAPATRAAPSPVCLVSPAQGRSRRTMNARLPAELLGTFMFMMVGAVVRRDQSRCTADDRTRRGAVRVRFGLLAAIFAFGHISGGHFNPAVTVGIVLDKRPLAVGGAGVIAQIIGAIGAAAVIYASLGQATVAAGITKLGAGAATPAHYS
jgi:ribulose-5-phosphate 4-epimerase/fuculose-1-phosphate aldolase